MFIRVQIVVVLLVTFSVVLFFSGTATVNFRNIAAEAGLVHTLPNGGVESKQYILETTGSGAAFLDYDNDDRLDIFLVAGERPRSATRSLAKQPWSGLRTGQKD